MATKELALSRTWTTTEVVRIVGCSYRQLDYWCRTGLIPGQGTASRGSGRPRQWDQADVQRARLVHLASQLSNMPLEKTVALLEREFWLQAMDNEARALTQGNVA